MYRFLQLTRIDSGSVEYTMYEQHKGYRTILDATETITWPVHGAPDATEWGDLKTLMEAEGFKAPTT